MAVIAPVQGKQPTVVGRVAGVERDGRPTVLVVETSGGHRRITLDATPDVALARRLTSGLRRVRWVRIGGSPLGRTCELVGASHRAPVRRSIPLAAGLALAAAGIPTLVTGAEAGAA